MTVVGVTGAFCTGKTTVCGFFKELGARVIDADKIVHRLYKKNKKIKALLKKNFGEQVLRRGKIDRTKLAKIAFSSKKNLNRLCRIVHPSAIRIMKEEAARSHRRVTVLDAPLLIEAGLSKEVDYVVAVTASMKKRIKRCVTRKYTKKDIRARSARQMSLRKKIGCADFVINNNGSKRYAKKKVRSIWQTLNGR